MASTTSRAQNRDVVARERPPRSPPASGGEGATGARTPAAETSAAEHSPRLESSSCIISNAVSHAAAADSAWTVMDTASTRRARGEGVRRERRLRHGRQPGQTCDSLANYTLRTEAREAPGGGWRKRLRRRRLGMTRRGDSRLLDLRLLLLRLDDRPRFGFERLQERLQRPAGRTRRATDLSAHTIWVVIVVTPSSASFSRRQARPAVDGRGTRSDRDVVVTAGAPGTRLDRLAAVRARLARRTTT